MTAGIGDTVRDVSQRARENLPGWAVKGSRATVQGWGFLTAEVRMLPEFLIVGGQRCGTTTLFRVLSDHPQVIRPTLSKGINYFDINYVRGPRWYRAHFPLKRSWRRTGSLVTFESSGYYSHHPLAAERIGRDLPGVRLVMMVRDPAERAFSAYKHAIARGLETESFTRALELEPQRLEGEVEKMTADPRYQSYSYRHQAYVTRGQYAEQIQRLQDAVGPEKVYVMDADSFFSDPVGEFGALTHWLALDPWTPPEVGRWNARTSAPMPPEIRERLDHHFEPHDLALTEVLGHPPSWRPGWPK